MLRSALPTALPLLLLCFSFWRAGLYEDYRSSRDVRHRLIAAESRLQELRGKDVANEFYKREHQKLTVEFAAVTGLGLDPETAVTKGEVSAQMARFVDAVIRGLKEERFAGADERSYLLFLSVTPGERQDEALAPFLSVDFELNLEGRFFALPEFLGLLSRIAEDQRCAISIGELRLEPLKKAPNTGRLLIRLPLRAYFYGG